MNDTYLEKVRYDNEALSINKIKDIKNIIGSQSIEFIYRDCYLYYEKLLKKHINKSSSVLEIACGYGRHSNIPISNSLNYTGIDISSESIQLAKFLYPNSNFITGNFVDYDFENKFDVIICAGSLSYFDFDILFDKIDSISNKDTKIILVDSLNDNFFYKLKRYIDYKKNKRTKSTLINMPCYNILIKLKNRYRNINHTCFGILMFLYPLSYIIGESSFCKFVSYTDRKLQFFEKYSFKIVINISK